MRKVYIAMCFRVTNVQPLLIFNWREKSQRHFSDSHTANQSPWVFLGKGREHRCVLGLLQQGFLASATHLNHVGSVNNHLLIPQTYSRESTIIDLEGVLDPGSLKSSLGEFKKQRGLRTTMESFPKIHPGKKPFFVFSEKSHFLVSKAHLQVIVK